MATKTKLTRLESELEKSRAEENWKKAEELARQLSVKSTGQGKGRGAVMNALWEATP